MSKVFIHGVGPPFVRAPSAGGFVAMQSPCPYVQWDESASVNSVYGVLTTGPGWVLLAVAAGQAFAVSDGHVFRLLHDPAYAHIRAVITVGGSPSLGTATVRVGHSGHSTFFGSHILDIASVTQTDIPVPYYRYRITTSLYVYGPGSWIRIDYTLI